METITRPIPHTSDNSFMVKSILFMSRCTCSRFRLLSTTYKYFSSLYPFRFRSRFNLLIKFLNNRRAFSTSTLSRNVNVKNKSPCRKFAFTILAHFLLASRQLYSAISSDDKFSFAPLSQLIPRSLGEKYSFASYTSPAQILLIYLGILPPHNYVSLNSYLLIVIWL